VTSRNRIRPERCAALISDHDDPTRRRVLTNATFSLTYSNAEFSPSLPPMRVFPSSQCPSSRMLICKYRRKRLQKNRKYQRGCPRRHLPCNHTHTCTHTCIHTSYGWGNIREQPPPHTPLVQTRPTNRIPRTPRRQTSLLPHTLPLLG
jgi:hypothetical protein